MSLSLYRKYRPQDFKSVVGQKSAVNVILTSLQKSRIGHAYLFSGSRGCGKTSVARIFAKALNCKQPENFEPCGHCKNCLDITEGGSLDVVEIDGASNNGVDEIRELKSHVNLAPFNSKYKIYIIDEVHMLTTAAFNALLKTLEEPPEYVVFILATTEPHKVPVTIRSRCQHIPFHSISAEDIFNRLKEICNLENVNFENDALWEISRQADGALRDALSILEQLISSGNITLENVENILGAGSRPTFERWIKNFREDPGDAFINLKSMLEAGASSARIFEELFSLVKDLWLVNKWPKIINSLGSSEQDKNFLKSEAPNWKAEKLHAVLNALIKILTQSRAGVRADILTGLFILELEKPEETPEINNNYNSRSNINTPFRFQRQNQEIKVAEHPEKIQSSETDMTDITQEIINSAHEKNFLIYCGLLNSKIFKQNNNLIIAFNNIYCYNVMLAPLKISDIGKIFQEYEIITLKYKNLHVDYKNENNFKPDITQNRPGEKNLQNDSNNIKTENNILNFNEFINGLKNYGTTANLIVSFRKENENENDNDNDENIILNGDNDNEGDND